MQQAGQARPAMPVQDPHTLGTVKTMRREGEQVRAQPLHIHLQPARARLGIHVQRDAPFMGRLADLPDRLNRADVVIDMVDRD